MSQKDRPSSISETAVWIGRSRRIREYAALARRRLPPARRWRAELDDLVQEGALAWVKAGYSSAEYLPAKALAAVDALVARAEDTPRLPRRSREIVASDPRPSLDVEEREALARAIERLPLRQRQVASRRIHPAREHSSYTEIARELGLTVECVRVHGMRAFMSLPFRLRELGVHAENPFVSLQSGPSRLRLGVVRKLLRQRHRRRQ